jgi:2-polyprenyl-6-methoxyphenol hydroxylase-like FAD-dependent oxidoreductase
MPNEFNPMVLIAGGGPTGLMAALELKRFGIAVRIVDEAEGPATTSRAMGIQARTLEEMELRGLADEFVRLGNRANGGDIYGQGKRLARIDFAGIASRYNYLLFLSQTETERILREALKAEGAAVEWGVKMAAFAQNPTGVTATLEHADGQIEELKVAYMVDAEGAHSVVRSSLGLDFKGSTFKQSYVLGDVHIDSTLVNTDFHIFSSEHGFMGLFPLGGSEFRLVATNSPAAQSDATQANDAPPTLEFLQSIYDQRSHVAARLRQMTWSSWFHINSRMVSRLRVGRIFLSGDAAHIHSPAGAQGMNTGIQDAINLGWKLALVLQARATEDLLDTYEQDRLPVMRSIVSRTEGLTEIVGTSSSIMRSFFLHMAPWIASADFVQKTATAQISQISLNYRNSPISDEHFAEGSLLAGDRVPDSSLRQANGKGEGETIRLFSLLNPSRFTLLVANFADAASALEKISQSISSWQDMIDVVLIQSPQDEMAKQFQDVFGSKASITLVRPDAYIGFRGTESSIPDLARYCKRWFTSAAEQQAA